MYEGTFDGQMWWKNPFLTIVVLLVFSILDVTADIHKVERDNDKGNLRWQIFAIVR